MLGNHFRAVSVPSCTQQNYAINCNFRQASSKHLITPTPKIYPFVSKSLSKISSAKGLPGLLPVGQARRQSYLPKGKIYLSRTTRQGLFRALNDGIRQLVICLQIKLPAEFLDLFLFYFYFFIQEEHL